MTDLGLDLRSTGRAKAPLAVEVVRELGSEDLALLALEKGVKPPALKALRDTHHAVARLIAEGRKGVEIGLITGMSQSRISILKGDPAFQELVSFYKTKVEEIRDIAFADAQAKLAALHSDFVDELSDRLHEKPESFSNEEVLDAVIKTADRTGNGPQSKSTNVNVNIDYAARVSAGRARAARVANHPAPVEAAATVVHTPALPSPPLDGGTDDSD